jgi:hypothetical protein
MRTVYFQRRRLSGQARLREERSPPPPLAPRRAVRACVSAVSLSRHSSGQISGYGSLGWWGARIRGRAIVAATHNCRFVSRSPTRSVRGEHATVTWSRDGGDATMAGFDMPSDDTACPSERQCPVCRGPVRVVRVESGVPGLPTDLRRQMIKCSACKLVAVHTFALEQER